MSTAKNEFYPVKRAFDYAGEHYEQGERWRRPEGHRWDDKIIDSPLVGDRRVGETAEDADALINEHTRKELRAMCKERDLPVYGTKAELAARILEGGS